MALCAVPDATGALIVTEATVENCTGFILLESSDSLHFINQLFDPNFLTEADYSLLFQLGVSMPVMAYLVAWGFQVVINFLSQRDE
ncbi:MAG: hypothetical protein CL577_07595 [Alteromonadaceae bacterium]|nr:hypothetical protein [Alteromonadaceae bacterium]|tara:strand:- start:4556 stop:4813 length:258 start_codon:yes stop_codon:yes gene_type:complete